MDPGGPSRRDRMNTGQNNTRQTDQETDYHLSVGSHNAGVGDSPRILTPLSLVSGAAFTLPVYSTGPEGSG
jgi:hypothetical protein